MNTYPIADKKLHFLNALFAHVLGSEEDTFLEVRAAIDFLSHKLCLIEPLPDIAQTTRGIFELHGQASSACMLVHYHVDAPFVGMLWHRKKLLAVLEGVKDASVAVFVVTGLREAIMTGSVQKAYFKEQRYYEILGYTQELVSREKDSAQNLYLFFV